ncbi:MAG: hypothetical protein IPI22_14060 [Bacteroidetes bacterium]|nr:hypothetical protein [Bacteroidota bacterium]
MALSTRYYLFNASLVAEVTLTPPAIPLCVGESTTMLNMFAYCYRSMVAIYGTTPNFDTTEIVFNPSVTTTYTVTGIESGKCRTGNSIDLPFMYILFLLQIL